MTTSLSATASQITNVGGMDEFITGEPDSSLFTYQYHRPSAYAKHTINVPFRERFAFGKTLTAVLPFMGHVVNDIQLHFKLPPLYPAPPGSSFVGWVNCIGYAMIESLQIKINDVIFDSHDGVFMEIMDYITTPIDEAKCKAVGRYDTISVLPRNANGYQDIYVPFRFWFNKSLSSALPMRQEVKIVLKLRPFSECVTFDGPQQPTEMPLLNASMIVDYYILNDEERVEILNEPQSYLIEQMQSRQFSVTAGTSTMKLDLEFTKCVKELIFVCREIESIDNNDIFNYGRRIKEFRGGEFIRYVSLYFDGKTRLERLPESYYRLAVGPRYHTHSGNRNIYIMPLCEQPENSNPTGTANFSQYNSVEISLDFIDDVPNCEILVFGIAYNRITFDERNNITIEFIN